jgi:hypothetical protein
MAKGARLRMIFVPVFIESTSEIDCQAFSQKPVSEMVGCWRLPDFVGN